MIKITITIDLTIQKQLYQSQFNTNNDNITNSAYTSKVCIKQYKQNYVCTCTIAILGRFLHIDTSIHDLSNNNKTAKHYKVDEKWLTKYDEYTKCIRFISNSCMFAMVTFSFKSNINNTKKIIN